MAREGWSEGDSTAWTSAASPFFFSSRRRHTRWNCDWSSDVCSSDLVLARRYRYFPADVGIARALQRPNFAPYDALMHAVSELGWRWISVGTRASVTTLMWAAGFRMESAFTL